MDSIKTNISNKRSHIALYTEKIYRRMIRRPAYRLALFILGLPTFIISSVIYVLTGRNSEYDALKKSVVDELKAKGVMDQLMQEAAECYKRKQDFLNKKLSENDFNRAVNKTAEKKFSDLVDSELYKKASGTEVSLSGIRLTYCRLLDSRLFFVVSVITSFPMYILMIIYANPYMKYIFERLLMMIFVVIGVTVLVFTILHFSPSDPAVNILGREASVEQVEEFNRVYGLDQPYVVQLLSAFKSLFTFDLGKSYVGNEDIMSSISRKFPITLQVAFASLIVAVGIAIPSGVVSAIKQYSSYDYIFMLIALLGLSIPNFWLGLILILNFSIKLHWLPATYSAANWMTLIMPAIVLGTGLSASVARMTRSSMLEVKHQDYILTARAKGLSEGRVIRKHILGNAMIPIVTVVGLQFGSMLGGAAVTEKVFNINGIGSYIVDKQFIPDVPVVLAGVVYVAIVISIVNLIVDILYAFLDPRIKSKMKNY